MIKKPPKLDQPSWVNGEFDLESIDRKLYLDYVSPLQSKGRYVPYDKLHYSLPNHLDKKIVWNFVKMARKPLLKNMIELGDPPEMCKFFLTSTIQRAISDTDRSTTREALAYFSDRVGEKSRLNYLLEDLIEDESISSSQLEGAATTTRIAKSLIKTKRLPRSEDERMILGNFRMMAHAWKCRDKDLSLEFIKELHDKGVKGIDDNTYAPGCFKTDDQVCVVAGDGDGTVLHQPPTVRGLDKRMGAICSWANKPHEDNADYIHPLLKAITLHFAIGFEHPFQDGNGRVARAIFYWYMFKAGFDAFRYISISHLLKAKPLAYGKSYLYTETDEMDLTYFIEFQCKQIILAIKLFKDEVRKSQDQAEKFDNWIFETGLYSKLNDKQKVIFSVAKIGNAEEFTTDELEKHLDVSGNTARSILNGLVNLKLFEKKKLGRRWVYRMINRDHLIETWNL